MLPLGRPRLLGASSPGAVPPFPVAELGGRPRRWAPASFSILRIACSIAAFSWRNSLRILPKSIFLPGFIPSDDHNNPKRGNKYYDHEIGENIYIDAVKSLGYSGGLRRAPGGSFVLASGRAATPLRRFDLAQPRWRPAAPPAPSAGQSFQAEDRFFNLLTFLAQIRQHLVYIHGASILPSGCFSERPPVLKLEQLS